VDCASIRREVESEIARIYKAVFRQGVERAWRCELMRYLDTFAKEGETTAGLHEAIPWPGLLDGLDNAKLEELAREWLDSRSGAKAAGRRGKWLRLRDLIVKARGSCPTAKQLEKEYRTQAKRKA
jgi:hypothetical protein